MGDTEGRDEYPTTLDRYASPENVNTCFKVYLKMLPFVLAYILVIMVVFPVLDWLITRGR